MEIDDRIKFIRFGSKWSSLNLLFFCFLNMCILFMYFLKMLKKKLFFLFDYRSLIDEIIVIELDSKIIIIVFISVVLGVICIVVVVIIKRRKVNCI